MTMIQVVLFSILAGAAYALDGVVYRYGTRVNLNSRQVFLPIAGLSALFFLLAARHESAPLWLFVLAGTAGLSQYVMIWTIQFALRRGPLTPMWCALMLCFVPVILYAAIFLGEPLRIPHILALLAAAGAVAAAARSNTETSEAQGGRPRIGWGYIAILLLLVGLNGFSNIALKLASAVGDGSVFAGAENIYMAVFFGTPAIAVALEFAIGKGWPKPSWTLLGTTVIGAGGCSVGMGLLSLVVTAPAALVYTAMNSASILTAGVLSAWWFQEKRSPAWYAMIALSVAAIALGNL